MQGGLHTVTARYAVPSVAGRRRFHSGADRQSPVHLCVNRFALGAMQNSGVFLCMTLNKKQKKIL